MKTSKSYSNCGLYLKLEGFPWIHHFFKLTPGKRHHLHRQSRCFLLISLTNPKVNSAEEQSHIFETNVDWILRGEASSKHSQHSELLKGDIFKNRYHFLSVIHTYITFHQLPWPFPIYVFLLSPLTWLHVLRLESHWEKKIRFCCYLFNYLLIYISQCSCK